MTLSSVVERAAVHIERLSSVGRAALPILGSSPVAGSYAFSAGSTWWREPCVDGAECLARNEALRAEIDQKKKPACMVETSAI